MFSLRHKPWRLNDAVPPVDPSFLHLTNSVYANGSIYWLRADHGTESFRVIPVPSSILVGSCGRFATTLMELDGRLALLAGENVPLTKEDNVIPISLKMCILQEDQDKAIAGSTIDDYPWILESFAMPPKFDWRPERVDVIPLPGTDLFIVRSNDKLSFYYYNWKNKSYSNKFELNGTESFMNENADYGNIEFYTLVENLLPPNQIEFLCS